MAKRDCHFGFYDEQLLRNFSLRKFWQLWATFKKIWSNLRLRLPLRPVYATRNSVRRSYSSLTDLCFIASQKVRMEPVLLCFCLCVCVCVFFFAVSRQNSRVPTFNSRMIIHPCTKDSLEIIENMNVTYKGPYVIIGGREPLRYLCGILRTLLSCHLLLVCYVRIRDVSPLITSRS